MKTWIFAIFILIFPENHCSGCEQISPSQWLNIFSQSLYVSPIVEEVSLCKPEIQPQNFTEALSLLSQSIPLHIESDKSWIKILSPVFSRDSERTLWRAELLILETQKRKERLLEMKGWFLRLRIETEFFNNLIFVHLSAPDPSFSLQAFFQDYKELSCWLGERTPIPIKTTEDNWEQLLMDLVFEGMKGDIPPENRVVNSRFRSQRQERFLWGLPPHKTDIPESLLKTNPAF